MKKPVDYQAEVKDALEFLNSARQAPASIIPELVKMIGKFKGNNYMIEPNVQLQTNEGVKAVEDAIGFLSTQKAVKPYQIGKTVGFLLEGSAGAPVCAWKAFRA